MSSRINNQQKSEPQTICKLSQYFQRIDQIDIILGLLISFYRIFFIFRSLSGRIFLEFRIFLKEIKYVRTNNFNLKINKYERTASFQKKINFYIKPIQVWLLENIIYYIYFQCYRSITRNNKKYTKINVSQFKNVHFWNISALFQNII